MAKAVKLEDIAKCLGISNVTVSKALADKSGVSEELRKKIKELAKEMGYVPVSSQKSKPKGGTGNIGVMIPCRFVDNNNSFYWALYQQVVTQLQAKEYYAIIELISEEDEEACRLPKMLQDGKVDGLIVIGQAATNYSRCIWEHSHVPCIFLDFYDSHREYDTIISDGFYGMYILTDYLIKKGHRKIAFVGTPLSTSSITDRFFGYQKALLENNIPLRQDWIINDRDKSGNVFNIELPQELPTAFACNSDYSANMVINILNEQGIHVPNDISVVGFDNYLHPNMLNVEMTTYEVPMEKMAELGVKTLIRKINHKDYIKGVQILTGKLIIRDTVKEVMD